MRLRGTDDRMCIGCGKTRSVPVAGGVGSPEIGSQRAGLSESTPPPRSSRMLGIALVLTVCLMLLVGAGSWVIWSARTDPQSTKQVAQATEPNPDEQWRQAETPKERNRQTIRPSRIQGWFARLQVHENFPSVNRKCRHRQRIRSVFGFPMGCP